MRPAEITDSFYALVDQHIADLLSGKVEKRLHAQDFGKLLFIHPRHLTNTLIETEGTSVCEVMEARITAEASRMLLESSLPIAVIAQKLGWNEPGNFTKFFKGMTGTTPLKFRKGALATI